MSAIVITLFLNAIVFAVLYLLCTRRIRREVSGAEILDSIRDEVNALVVELNQTTDRNVSLTEERMTRLKELVADADRKIQLLSREIEKQQLGVEVYNSLKNSALRRSRAGETLQTNSAGATAARSDAPTEGPGLSARVLDLAQKGFDARIIAQKIGTTLGEVELILSLENRRSE